MMNDSAPMDEESMDWLNPDSGFTATSNIRPEISVGAVAPASATAVPFRIVGKKVRI